MKTAVFILLLLTSSLSAQTLQHDRLPGTKWECSVDNKPLGTITFKDAAIVELSWQAPTQWESIPEGIKIFGVPLTYADKTFIGVNAGGKSVSLTLSPGGESSPAMPATTEPANNPVAPAEEKKFETLETVKLVRRQDHAFTITGQKTAFGKSTNRNWETSWGSYSEDIQRSATYQFKVSHFGGEATALFEVLFLGRTVEGDQYPYAFESRRLAVNGDATFKFDIFHQSSESMYRALNIRIREGSKPDTWVAWMRNGDTIMGLAAGRGSLVDRYEIKPAELIALVKNVVK